MKHFLIAICYVFVTGLLLTCRHKEVEPDPFLDGTLRLKFISFSGIPQENISIDQKTKIITVQMPTILLDKTGVSVETTENAKWLYTHGDISPAVFGCAPCFEVIIANKKETNSVILDRGIDTIQTIPTGPLKIALLSTPLTYPISIGDDFEKHGISIPMLNLYGNKLPREAHLLNDATGQNSSLRKGRMVP